MFISQDFRFWKESMMDYHGAQRLLGYVLGQRQRPVAAIAAQPTQAELVAMADWDKIEGQVHDLHAAINKPEDPYWDNVCGNVDKS
jgi:hypothetical protein